MEKTALNRAGKLAENLLAMAIIQQLVEALDLIPEAELDEAMKHILQLNIHGEA